MIRADETIAQIASMGSNRLRVHPERCVAVRHRRAECGRCAAVCTTGAIAAAEAGIVVDPARCIGCGTCASACPSGCLEAQAPSDQQLSHALAAQLRDGDRVHIACRRAADHENGQGCITVACLGRIEESALLEAAARGAREIVLLSAACRSCENAPGSALCAEAVEVADALLRALGHPLRIVRVQADRRADGSLPAPDPESSGTGGVDAPLAFAHVQADGTLPHAVPQRKLRLYNSMKRLGAPDSGTTVRTRLWGSVRIDVDLCRSCRMCTVFCPTGALSRFDAGADRFGVSHRAALCTQCRLCESICPEGALHVDDAVDLHGLLRGEQARFAMRPVGWKPGQEEAIASRMARFINADALSDPQGTFTHHEFTEDREYAREREQARARIRAANGETV